jgi:P-type Cu+ transporter
MIFRHRQVLAADGTQQARVIVHGHYSPNVIRAQAGRPLRLVFDRRESGECTSRVVFPELGISALLPPFTQTAVELTPSRAGLLEFECGMNKIHGYLVVAPGRQATTHAAPQGHEEAS